MGSRHALTLEPGRDLLARYERPLRLAFARFDGLLDRVRDAGGPHVITHGEPHPGNPLCTQRQTGWQVHQDALTPYRLRSSLNDIAEFLAEIPDPHQQTADTLVYWTGLQEILEAITR